MKIKGNMSQKLKIMTENISSNKENKNVAINSTGVKTKKYIYIYPPTQKKSKNKYSAEKR